MAERKPSEFELTVQKIADGTSLNDTRARPKSQIFNLQSALARIFLGFKSRWKIFAGKGAKRAGLVITEVTLTSTSIVRDSKSTFQIIQRTNLYEYILVHA